MLNLVEDAWLPVRQLDGGSLRVSLRTALLRAHELRGLSLETPSLLPAVLRQTLLPLMADAVGFPRSAEEWGRRFAAGRFCDRQATDIEAYADKWRGRFGLFDSERPFAQVGGLESVSGETKPVTLLIPSVATGNNVPMFTAVTEAHLFSLPAQDAVLWLLHTQCWDTAAIKTGARGDERVVKGKTTGNPTGPLGQFGVIVPEGATLYETLMLNTPVVPDGSPEGDRPQWASATPAGAGWRSRPAQGLLDTWTWQSRRIRLIPQGSEPEAVSRVLVCAGDRLEAVRPEFEWHTAWTYTRKPKKGQPPVRPRRHRSGEHAWQGLGALLALGRGPEDGDGPRASGLLEQLSDLEATGHLPTGLPLRVHTCAVVYGNQSAIVEDVLADSLPLPVAALAADSSTQQAVLGAAEQTALLGQALNRLSADLRRAEGSDPLPWDKGQRPATVFLQATDAPMRRLLRGLQKEADDEERIEQGMRAWEQILYRLAWDVADRVLADVSPVTFLGRTKDGHTYRAARARAGFAGAVRRALPRVGEDDEGGEEEE